MKIRNLKLANLEVHFSTGAVQFDENGIGDVQPDELAEDVLKLNGYHRVEDITTDEEGVRVVEGDSSRDINSLTEKELDKLADEIGVEDYPKGSNKQTKKAAIGTHINASK